MGAKVAVEVKRVPWYNGGGNTTPPAPATPANKPKKPKPTLVTAITSQRKAVPRSSAGELKPMPRTPPNEPRVLVSERATPNQVSTHTKKVRKGHRPQLSFSSDEEEKMRSKTAKKVRTREPSWSIPPATTQVQPSLLLPSVLPREKEGSDSGRSTSTGIRLKTSTSSSSSTDNDLSTASTETAAATVSTSSTSKSQAKHNSPRNSNLYVQVPPPTQLSVEAKKSARRNPARNPSMFGHELPHPQRTPASPSRIPVSSPVPLSPPVNSAVSASPLSASSRPRTLRRAARRISFGSSAANGIPFSPVENPRGHSGETPVLGSAFQFA